VVTLNCRQRLPENIPSPHRNGDGKEVARNVRLKLTAALRETVRPRRLACASGSQFLLISEAC